MRIEQPTLARNNLRTQWDAKRASKRDPDCAPSLQDAIPGGREGLADQASRPLLAGSTGWIAPTLAGTAAALGVAALFNNLQTRRAERNYPPIGRFLDVDGVRLHYVEQGRGAPVVLIHGNGTMLQDYTTSGLIERLAGRHRVIVFDRPGYGYSSRPR